LASYVFPQLELTAIVRTTLTSEAPHTIRW
jgi:hypothetical protein